MLQPGDVGLIASLKIAFFAVLFGVIVPGLWILVFFFGFGFIGTGGSPGSTPLPPVEYLSPALVVCIMTLIMVATYDRTLMLPGVILALLAAGFTFFWEVVTVIKLLGFCATGALACSMADFWLYFFFLLLVGWIFIGLFVTFFASLTYMSGYWQREYYMSRESNYQQVVDGSTYDPTFDPDDPTEDIRDGDFDRITKKTRLAKSATTEAQEEEEEGEEEEEEGERDEAIAGNDAETNTADGDNGIGLDPRNVAAEKKRK